MGTSVLSLEMDLRHLTIQVSYLLLWGSGLQEKENQGLHTERDNGQSIGLVSFGEYICMYAKIYISCTYTYICV